jgi:microcin C transport system permease protein
MIRRLSIVSFVVGLLALLGEWFELELPSIAWFFSLGQTFGWVSSSLLIIGGLVGLLVLPAQVHWTPVTLQRFRRFRSIRRGWWSFLLLLVLVVLALLDQALVGRRALVVKHEGSWYFPAFVKQRYPEKTFFGTSEAETDYRQLKQRLAAGEGKGFVLMPLVPWAAVLDSDDKQTLPLIERDGLFYRQGQERPYSGRALRFYEGLDNAKHSDVRVRRGVPDGEWLGYAPNGGLVLRANYRAGEKVREEFTGEMTPADFAGAKTTGWTVVVYPAIPPLWKAGHYLGTDSRGWDVLAQMFGGWQLNLKAILIYLTITYGVGILIGTLMGFWGGWFDLMFQRIIEILENLPFLYIVMIVVGVVGVANMNLPLLLSVICLFSWTGLTYSLRALSYKEKERDYIAAARLQGASTWRIVTRYLVPNVLATLVTIIPFSVVGIMTSLTALAFVGFGLPETYAQWGVLFDDGLNHLSAVWITFSMFAIMVIILLLVTFVGEALREAFDPKKFSTYQ